MNSKQECIAKAYEKHGYNWEEIKEVVSQDGWCNCRLVSKLSLSGKQEDSECGYYVRPIELKGIENNNGWIKIESENDLPKDGWHWTLSIVENEPFETHYEDINIGYHTHYQPITKPEPPLH